MLSYLTPRTPPGCAAAPAARTKRLPRSPPRRAPRPSTNRHGPAPHLTQDARRLMSPRIWPRACSVCARTATRRVRRATALDT
eukprot:793809-Prymnesium_polylepis.1